MSVRRWFNYLSINLVGKCLQVGGPFFNQRIATQLDLNKAVCSVPPMQDGITFQLIRENICISFAPNDMIIVYLCQNITES